MLRYADVSGSEEYNDNLSRKRVYAVYNYMLSQTSFDTSKVYIDWIGESDEVYDLHFLKAHTQERSIDIWIQFNNIFKKTQKQ